MGAPVRVFLVDDHPVVLAGLSAVLARQDGIDIVGTASSGEQALEDLGDLAVDLVLLDHRLGSGIDGVELCRRLSAEPYSLRCLALSAGADATTLRTFLAAGSRGLLLKQADPQHIVDAIHTVLDGGMFVDPQMTALLMEEVAGTATGLASLNARERAVLRLIAAGFSNPEMARQLRVSHSSIKAYVSSILHKLHVNYRAEAVAIAAREGLLDGAGVSGAAE